MNAEISKNLYGKTVAVAVSGGEDSMALLHFTANFCARFRIKTVALNVEHGIRGENSLRDSAFVKDYCKNHDIPLLEYKVNAPKKAKADKFPLEQAARILRYECFFDAVKSGKCDAVFTAHHSSDNLESVLFNLFRGTGIKGLSGIQDYNNVIYRPFIKVSKAEITEYVKQHAIPYVNDETNFCIDYTRNFLRLNVIPKIKEVFPEAEKSVLRLSETLKEENVFLDALAKDALISCDGGFYIPTDTPKAVMARAIIIALKNLGLTKDYEKKHVDDVRALCEKENGKTVSLPLGIKAAKEYDKITIYKDRPCENETATIAFTTGLHALNGRTITATPCGKISDEELKKGFYADLDKIPETAMIRFRKKGDRFTKFGGGTKSLSDYFTDKKIPLKDRDGILLVADKNDVLIINGIAVSDKIRVDKNTQNVVKFS
ncbi:MAG: tRNA lysidine(34) synthetase TilS [Clostridia bacterium]|nr:tRNA lysidine(34) synthetase TilS [Clostridia bacterium]